MGRGKDKYVLNVDYSRNTRSSKDSLHDVILHLLEAGAREHALQLTKQMRREGPSSEIRSIKLRRWGAGDDLSGACVLHHASYYDPEQGLTETETYSARVHQWHEPSERFSQWGDDPNVLWGMARGRWRIEWGPEPAFCPSCGRTFEAED